MAAVRKTSCFLVLFAAIVLNVSPAPTSLTTEYNPKQIDFGKTYLQFFKIKDLIEKINIKKFREFQENRANGITGPDESPEVLPESSIVGDKNLPEIDLTEEAIINDSVSVNLPALDTYKSEETTGTLSTASEEVTTLKAVEEVAVTELATSAPTIATTTSSPATTQALREDSNNILPDISAEDALLNEIDTGDENDKFFISKESVESAKKFGYKILLKKINGKEVAVGKIKFSFPTLVEINPVEDEVSKAIEPETAIVTDQTLTATTTPAVEEPFEISNDAKDGATEALETTTLVAASVESENVVETTTALAVTFVAPPLESVIPTVEALDEYSITEGVKQITEDTEVAIKEIKNQNSTETVVFDQCVAPFTDVEDMLMSLAQSIALQTPMISEILSVGKSLKDEKSPEMFSRSGAKLLQLLEPFLESLVPAQLSGCAGESSNAMLISLSGMASQLDTIASNEINQDRANSLHKSATSLQLAAWVMAQLQSSVHTFYSQEGICGDEDSSTTEILGSLSKAITGYIPIVTMLGNQDSVDELKETIEALNKAQTDIAELEANSGTSLPGVECGASFSEMAEALENLADFVAALDLNQV